MSLTVSYDPVIKVIISVLQGTVDPEELRQETIQATALAKKHDCKLFLSDFSQATINFSMVDVFNLPGLQADAGLDRSIRVAVIAPTFEIRKELAHFYELVSTNRGWVAKVSQDRQEAIDWLLE